MNIYKKGIRQKLRFKTTVGTIGVGQLFDLKLTQLSTIVRSLKKQLTNDNDDELSFLDESAKKVDATLQLKFDIAKDVYLTLKGEKDALKDAANKKAHNQKIDELIAKKQEADLENKSIEELEKMRIQ